MKINIEQDGNDNNQNNTFNLNIPETKELQAVPSNVGKSTVNFVGREDELTLIHQQLQTEQGVIVCAVEEFIFSRRVSVQLLSSFINYPQSQRHYG